ncbi:hypothetical protein [Haloarcula brevis]|uniref:hypothetical protein n=1 Tax=Haloarcula brevis TaxID=3111453 RepID=UPI00300F71C6
MESVTDGNIARRVYGTVASDDTDAARVLEQARTNDAATVQGLAPPLRRPSYRLR